MAINDENNSEAKKPLISVRLTSRRDFLKDLGVTAGALTVGEFGPKLVDPEWSFLGTLRKMWMGKGKDNQPSAADKTPAIAAKVEAEKLPEVIEMGAYLVETAERYPTDKDVVFSFDFEKLRKEHPEVLKLVDDESFRGYVFMNPTEKSVRLNFKGAAAGKVIRFEPSVVKQAAMQNVPIDRYAKKSMNMSEQPGFDSINAGLILVGSFLIDGDVDQNTGKKTTFLGSSPEGNAHKVTERLVYGRSFSTEKDARLSTIDVVNTDFIGPALFRSSNGDFGIAPAAISVDQANLRVALCRVDGGLKHNDIYAKALETIATLKDVLSALPESDPKKPKIQKALGDTEKGLVRQISPHDTRGELTRGILVSSLHPDKRLSVTVEYCEMVDMLWDAISCNGPADLKVKGIDPPDGDEKPVQSFRINQDQSAKDYVRAGAGISMTHSPGGTLEVVGVKLDYTKGIWCLNESSETTRIHIRNSDVAADMWAFNGQNTEIAAKNNVIHLSTGTEVISFDRTKNTYTFSSGNPAIPLDRCSMGNEGITFKFDSPPGDESHLNYLFSVSQPGFKNYIKGKGGLVQAFESKLRGLDFLFEEANEKAPKYFLYGKIKEAVGSFPYNPETDYYNISLAYDRKEKRLGVMIMAGADLGKGIPYTGQVKWVASEI